MKMRHLVMAVLAVVTMSMASASAASFNPVKEKVDSKINWGTDGAPSSEPKTLREMKDLPPKASSHSVVLPNGTYTMMRTMQEMDRANHVRENRVETRNENRAQTTMERNFCERTHGCGAYGR